MSIADSQRISALETAVGQLVLGPPPQPTDDIEELRKEVSKLSKTVSTLIDLVAGLEKRVK